MSILGARSTSFSFGQPPANKPFSFGGSTGGGGGGGGAATTPTGQQQAGTSQQQNAAPSFSFGGAATQGSSQPAAAPSSSLFGGLSNAPKPSGFSFGQPQNAQQPQQNQQQPPQSGSLFGGFGQSQQTQQLGQNQTGQQPFGSSLFGSSTQNTAAQGSSLFGNNNQQQSQQPHQQGQQSGFSLGGSTQPFSFNQSQQQQPQASQGFGFGQSSQTVPNQQQQQQQLSLLQSQSQSSVQINPSSPFARQAFHQKERFNELPEESRKLLEELDSHINSQIRLKDELASRDFGTEIQKRRSEWNDLHSTLSNSTVILEQDAELIQGVVDRVERDRADFVSLFEIAQNFKEGKTDGKQWVNWPGEFFAKAATEFKERITRYRSTMEEIGKQLSTIDSRNEHSPELISNVIVSQHSTFMSLASNVANLHAEIDQLKKDYTQWYQQQYRSVQDPFAMSLLTSTIG